MGWGPEWGDAGGGRRLLPLTSTGGQCNIKVSSSLLGPAQPDRGPRIQESGSAGYVWKPWWAGASPGGLGAAEPLENQVCWFVFFLVLTLELQRELTEKAMVSNTQRSHPFLLEASRGLPLPKPLLPLCLLSPGKMGSAYRAALSARCQSPREPQRWP